MGKLSGKPGPEKGAVYMIHDLDEDGLPVWSDKFLEVLEEQANIGNACEAVGVSRSTVQSLQKRVPEFDRAMKLARARAGDRLREEAWRRAVQGTEEPVFQGGVQVGTIRRYSDRLLELLLRGAFPEEFSQAPKVAIGIQNRNGTAENLIDASTLSPEQVAGILGVSDVRELQEAARRMAAGQEGEVVEGEVTESGDK